MRRFELIGPRGTRFWEVEQVGVVLTMRSGLAGERALPEEREERYRNVAEARRELERLVRTRLANGWLEQHASAPAEEFEAALASGDEARWMVFADRLLAEGDPRGELITLQQQLGRKREAKQRIEAFVDAHEQALLGAVADHREQLELEWRLGYLREAGLHCTASDPQRDEQPIEGLVGPLLGLESSRFLHTLRIGWPDPGRECSYESVVDELKRCAWPRHLRELVLGDFSESTALSSVARFDEAAWLEEETGLDLWPDLRSLAPLAPKLRGLEALCVRANLRGLGLTQLPALRSLEVHCQHATQGLLEEVLRLEAPALEGLVVDFPHSPSVSLRTLAPVLEGTLFPALTRLGVCGVGPTALELCAAAAILPRLTHLELSGDELGDDDARRLVLLAPKLQHLTKLSLRRNSFSKAAVKELKAAIPGADFAHQRARRRSRGDRLGELE